MWLVKLAFGLALAYAALVAVSYLVQTRILFPTGASGSTPDTLPPGAELTRIAMPDGVEIAALRIAARSPAATQPLILGFGGNAWNAASVAHLLHRLFPSNDVMAVYYRGYRPSGGRPSAKALLADAVAVHDHLDAPQGIVAVGFSIGAGVAAHLAAERPVSGLLMVTPFDSLEALARHHYPWAPVGALLLNHIDTADYLRSVDAPVAIITAQNDTIVPAARSAPVRAAAKRLVHSTEIQGAGHNDLYDRPEFAEAMREALQHLEAAKNPAYGRN